MTSPNANSLPTTKVAAGGIAGAVTVVLVYVLGLAHVVLPAEVGSAITVLFSVAASYLIRDRAVVMHPATRTRP